MSIMINPHSDDADTYGICIGRALPLNLTSGIPCECQQIAADMQPRFTILIQSTHPALDDLDAARRIGMDIPWSGPAASYFRGRLETLSKELAATRDQLDTLHRLIAQG